MDLALLALRLVAGLLFAGHGAQKRFGAFGGAGIGGTADTFEKLRLRPARAHALGAGLLGGTAAVLGGRGWEDSARERRDQGRFGGGPGAAHPHPR